MADSIPANMRGLILATVRPFLGSDNTASIPAVFIRWTGDLTAALVLNQVSFHQRTPDQHVPIPYAYWQDQYGLSEYKIRRAAKDLASMNIGFSTVVKKHEGNPTVHYHLDLDTFEAALVAYIQNGNSTPSSLDTKETSETDGETDTEVSSDSIEDQELEQDQEQDLFTGAQSAPVNGGDDEQPETPKRRKKREAKPRPRDAYIDALAECAFNVPPGQPIGKQTGGRCAAVKAELLAVYDKLQPEHIRAAYQWYAKAHPDMSPPRDAVKVLAMVGEFRQALETQKAKQAQPKKPLVLDPPLYDPVWPEIDRDHTGRYVGPNGGTQ